MATVNKPGVIIGGIDVPEWDSETTTNSRLVIIIDPVQIDDSGAANPITGIVSTYCDYLDLTDNTNKRYSITTNAEVVLTGGIS